MGVFRIWTGPPKWLAGLSKATNQKCLALLPLTWYLGRGGTWKIKFLFIGPYGAMARREQQNTKLPKTTSRGKQHPVGGGYPDSSGAVVWEEGYQLNKSTTTRSPSSVLLTFLGWEGSPTKVGKNNVGYQLILTSNYWRTIRQSAKDEAPTRVWSKRRNIQLWLKKTQISTWHALVSGNMDQNLRFAPG